ncbi:hypothetical protein IE4771_PE00218 (plasmid) [Rhizobium etli bv. mimosae str. IE4771]|uniref:Uncharacterized protein n=1 Tax=Rhizobium etli bv. mimosae str. IE4771 TaxID=1432050 RepID=A0A060I904_RHIET|nr:hypothetical protein IE4771_PE00218 [Rhizobium sp. IE4771]
MSAAGHAGDNSWLFLSFFTHPRCAVRWFRVCRGSRAAGSWSTRGPRPSDPISDDRDHGNSGSFGNANGCGICGPSLWHLLHTAQISQLR